MKHNGAKVPLKFLFSCNSFFYNNHENENIYVIIIIYNAKIEKTTT